ncbi:tetratricopeptide repeat protein [Micromonospora coerulea]|uniref:tetratricopeptide repeat protein n=1 Tax=Micromonospora coerulea TaxID=47856 RepID=UPI0031F7C316
MSLAVRIALLRPLARHDPLRYGPRLAEALVTRSHQVSGLPGSTARRTASAEEAVALYRRLERDQPGRHLAGLARALVAQATVPDGHTVASAMAQGREAIGYVQDAGDREALLVLAEARRLVATSLHATGAVREALRLALSAQATWRRCAPVRAAERMGLARTLIAIGDCQGALGRPEEALAAHQEAMNLYRELSLHKQSRWRLTGQVAAAGLAESLTAVGRWEDALALAEEFRGDLETWFWLRLQSLQARSMLGRLLRTVAYCREALGEPDAALRAAEEAVDHQRWLVENGLAGSRSDLAAALRTYGGLLLRSGEPEAGADRVAEAVETARGASDAELAWALIALAVARMSAGQWDEVEPLLDELVPVCRRRADELPEVFQPLLVRGLAMVVAMTAFDLLAVDGRPAAPLLDRVAGLDGVTAGREAVALARQLAEADPRHRELLGHALFGLERAVNRTGDVREAAELLRECVALRRELFAEDPAAHRSDLAQALGNLGNRLHALGRLAEALPAHEESVALIRAADSGLPPAEAVAPLRNLARTLAALGRPEEAERIAAKAETPAET